MGMNSFRFYSMIILVSLLTGFGCGPRSAEKNLQDGINALRRDRFRLAERRLRAAAMEKPESAEVAAHLAMAQWKNGALPEAIVSMRRAVALAPDNERLPEYLGLLLLAAGEDRAALEVLSEAATVHPDSPRLVTALAVARWRLGDTDTAGELLTAVRERDPDYPPAVYNMARFQLDEMQDARRARTLFQHYLTLAPGAERVSDARHALTQLDSDMAERYSDNDPPFAPPDNGPRSPYESSSPRHINRANAAIHRGDLDEAYIHLQTAIRNDENDAHALWVMGEFTEEHLRAPERAARVWRDFINRFPGDPRAGEARQRLRYLTAIDADNDLSLTNSNDTMTSVLEFNREPRRDAAGARREFQRGMEYQAAGDWDRATFHFTRAIEKDDTQINAFIQLARAYEQSGELQLAADACRYALMLRPDLTSTRLQSARILLRKGLRPQAMAQLETVLRQDPAQAEAHLLTGMLLRGDPDRRAQARYHLERYLVLMPDGDHADRVRNWLASGGD